MFNSEIKERYLEIKPEKTANNLRNILASAEEFEIKFEKDVAEFTLEEFAELMDCGSFVEPHTIRDRVGKFSSYAKWYCDYCGIKTHVIDEYNVRMFPYEKYFAATVTKTPEELIGKITQVYDVDSAQPAIPMLCFAWLGLDSDDAAVLRKEQVDTVHGKIYDMTGNVIVAQMPDIIREVLDVYGKTYTAIRTQNQTFTVYAEDLGYFIKRMKSQNSEKVSRPFSKRQLVGYIANMQDLYEEAFTREAAEWLNYSNVQRSGAFYRLHQMAKSGVDVRSNKNADKVRLCLGASKRNHKDNMLMYDAYLEVIGEK